MSTSGTSSFTETRDQIIQNVLEICKAISIGSTPDTVKVNMVSNAMNTLAKYWLSEGIRLWTMEWVTQTFAESSTVSNGGKGYRCIRSNISSTTDQPGIGANYTTFWIEDSTAIGAPAWQISTPYSSVGNFTVSADTVGIEKAFIRNTINDQNVEIISKFDYMGITNKTDQGRPTQLFFDLKLIPVIYLYPQPNTLTDVLHYLRIRKLQDFNNATDNPDMPVHWIEPFTWNVAAMVCHKFNLPLPERQMIEQKAEFLKKKSRSSDKETIDLKFTRSCY